MLKTKEPMATVAVKDLEAARKFYEGKLGLTLAPDGPPGTAMYKCGGASLFVYQSAFAGTNQATAVSWMVGNDLDSEVKALKKEGIAFEHYDLPDVRREGDVHIFGAVRTAWFKDPDGNIHALVNG